jgi:hypothetical protein
MPIILDSYFEVEGLTIKDKVDILAGVPDPRAGMGTDARMGSMYLRSNGETWKKIGIGTQDWALEAGGGLDDDSRYALTTRAILVTDSYTVEVDVGLVSFNHYYEEGVVCTLQAPNYYQHPVIIKNLSGLELEILPSVGRVEGKKKFILNNRFSSVTLSPLQNDWVITSVVEGVKYVPEKPKCGHCDH